MGGWGGSLACGTCYVYVEPSQFAGLPPPVDDEDAMLDMVASERRPCNRLGCQIKMSEALDGLILRLPPDQYRRSRLKSVHRAFPECPADEMSASEKRSLAEWTRD
jgi:hypothetical protein